MENQLQQVGRRIREARTVLDISVAEMAKLHHITEEEYLRYENGEADPSFMFLYRCANRFGMDPGALATGESPKLSFYTLTRAGTGLNIRPRRAGFEYLHQAAHLKNRLAGGLDKDLQFLLNYTRDSHAYSPFTDALMQAGTWQTRWADKWSTLHGGFAAYQYALKQAKKSGMTETEAIGAARRAWMRWTDETQQSGYFKDQNYFQANQGAFRYLTAFMSNPIQVMNLQLQTMNEIRYGKNKKAAWGKLGRQILVNHLVVPTLMQFTVDMFRHGFDVPEWWDEAEIGDYLLAWGLGSFG